MSRRWVARNRDGSYSLRLDDDLASLLGSLAAQLDPLLDDPSADPALRRLFPPAHPDDLMAEAAWQIEQGSALADTRRAALDVIRSAAPDARMSEAELISWMQGLNSLRLVLAERLQVADDAAAEDDTVRAAQALLEDPSAAETEREGARRLLATWQVYDLLALLISHAVRALS